MSPLSPIIGVHPHATVHPDHIDAHIEDRLRVAHSRVEHCILNVARRCCLHITDLLSRSSGQLSKDELTQCIDDIHADVLADAQRFPTVNDSIDSVLSQQGVCDVLPPQTIDDYRALYDTRLIHTIRRVLPVYRPLPHRPQDMAAADATLVSLLANEEDPEGWREPALLA